MSPFLLLRQWLDSRLEPRSRAWLKEALREIADGAPAARFGALFSLASRFAPARPLAPEEKELRAASQALEGWRPERWDQREAARVELLLSRPDLGQESAVLAIDELFRYADEGEQRALCRSLALLPAPERFLERARAGCRTNMRSVFEATALDTPYPFRWFDDPAWNQAVIKCLFLEAPLWRMFGLDRRLSAELARMALDFADERRSAGRVVNHELWLCLGEHGGERALESLERELDPANPHAPGRRAAALALARAGAGERLRERHEREADPLVRESMAVALQGPVDSESFRTFE